MQSPVLLSLLVGGMFVALGLGMRGFARFVRESLARMRRVWARSDLAFRRRLSRRFAVVVVLIAGAGVIATLGVTGMMARQQVAWVLVSFGFPVFLFLGLSIGMLTTCELIVGRILFGVRAGPAWDRVNRALMVAPLLVIVLLLLVVVPSLLLYRMSCLQLTILGPEWLGTRTVIQSMEQRLLAADNVLDVAHFKLDRKVLAYDVSRVALLSSMDRGLGVTREQWNERDIPPLIVIRVLRIARRANTGHIRAAVGRWPEREVLGVMEMELPWPSQLNNEPFLESREHWERTCASHLIVKWLKSKMSLLCSEPFRKWTDSSGTYTTMAKLVEFKDDAIVLEKKDGERKLVKTEQLSQADVDYVKMKKRDLHEVVPP